MVSSIQSFSFSSNCSLNFILHNPFEVDILCSFAPFAINKGLVFLTENGILFNFNISSNFLLKIKSFLSFVISNKLNNLV